MLTSAFAMVAFTQQLVLCLPPSLCCVLLDVLLLQAPASLLPLSVRKDPKKLDAYFALRQMANQQLMWFRLLGVSGAAVAVADRAQRRCQAVTSKANGAARFARKYVRGAVQRLQQEKQQALQHQKEQLEQQAAVQLQEQAGVHAAAIAAAEVQHQERQAALLKDVAALQQAREEDQLLINDLKVRERELAADARSKADVIAEQRATASSLHQQLVEVKSEKAGLSHELREVRDQLAREKGRVEAMLHEEQEVCAGWLLGPLHVTWQGKVVACRVLCAESSCGFTRPAWLRAMMPCCFPCSSERPGLKAKAVLTHTVCLLTLLGP